MQNIKVHELDQSNYAGFIWKDKNRFVKINGRYQTEERNGGVTYMIVSLSGQYFNSV